MIYDACPPVTDKDVYSGEIDDKDLLDNWNTYNNEYLILRYERDAFKEDRIREEVIAARNNQLKDYLKIHCYQIRKDTEAIDVLFHY